jgi:hypothetical protein
MGKMVDVSSLPAPTVRGSQYDADIQEALKMPADKAWQLDIPEGTKPESVNMAVRDRIKKAEYSEKVHVRKIGDAVYILKGRSPTAPKKKSKS